MQMYLSILSCYHFHFCNIIFICKCHKKSLLGPIVLLYSRLSLRHPYKTDTSVKLTSRVSPHFLYSLYLTLYKTDTLSAIPKLKLSVFILILQADTCVQHLFFFYMYLIYYFLIKGCLVHIIITVSATCNYENNLVKIRTFCHRS